MPDWIFQTLTLAGAVVGGYAAIRADLASLRAKVEGVKDRLDDHLRAHRAA